MNLQMALLFALVLRGVQTWLRVRGGARFVPLDRAIEAHRLVGYVATIFSIEHTLAHAAHAS